MYSWNSIWWNKYQQLIIGWKKSFQWGQKKVFINMLTVCNNERVAVTIEDFFCGFDTISLKLIFIPKYIDLRTFVVKISRVTFTYFAHRFDCSGQVWSQGSQNWFKYFRDWGIPTLKNGEMPPLLSGSYVRCRGVWRRRAGKKSVFAKQKQTFDPWPPNGSRVWCLRVR